MHEKWMRVGGSALLAAAVLVAAFLAGGGAGKPVSAAPGTGESLAADNGHAKGDGETAGSHSTWMTLRINGELIEGDTYDQNRREMIELAAFEQSVITAREAGSGLATGRRQYQPLLIRKRIDKSSPLLMKALTENSVVDAEFGFYRPNPTGDGTEERFYEIAIRRGRVSSVKIVQDSSGVPMEEVTFVFHTISWTYTNGGVTHEDTWDSRR
ncbi:MAG TPA: type VI secretion system tube protein TssD [Symbiobacteriaceae bacterium]|nr:type VI secretion system tube protein TssD [Symbiobacteriaceae bacterium]